MTYTLAATRPDPAQRPGVLKRARTRPALEATHRRCDMRGFTLIELMIVVAIIAILAAIAVPSYLRYVQRSRRSDAYAALSQGQGILERCYAQTFDYSKVKATTPPAGCSSLPTTSSNGYYTIALTAGASGALATSYTLTATPATGSPQASDTTCASISITSANVRAALDSAGNDQTATCWQQ